MRNAGQAPAFLFFRTVSNGGRFAGHLWAGNEREQIKLMRMIYRRLCEIGAAPEWMSEQQINDFAEQMLVV